MVRNQIRKPIGRTRALVYAVLVHALVIGLLIVSFRWQSNDRPRSAQKIVQAHVVDDTAARLAQEKLKQALLQQQKLAQEQAQKALQLQQQEMERQKQQEQAVQLKAAQAKKQREAAAAAAAAAAAEKKHLAELKKQQEKEAAEQQARQQKQAIASLQRQLAQEEKQRKASAVAAQNAAKAQSAIARYKDLIRQKVEQNWVRPLNTQKGMECVVKVKLVPGGDVLQARVVQTSGSAVFDRSVENAVYKASPLPLPNDPTLFAYFQELEFTFKPES